MAERTRVKVGLSLSKEIYEKLKEYSDETGIPQSRVLDRAIAAYLESKKRG